MFVTFGGLGLVSPTQTPIKASAAECIQWRDDANSLLRPHLRTDELYQRVGRALNISNPDVARDIRFGYVAIVREETVQKASQYLAVQQKERC